MNRETIEMSDIYSEDDYPWDKPKSGYKYIEDEQVSYDAEKNMIERRVVFQRLSDSKFFEVTYTEYNYSGDSLLEESATEVFPKTKTITVYE